MRLSRFGQGLAVSAVSALVITGLGVSAPAAVAAEASGVRLLSQESGKASVRSHSGIPINDSITLTAEQLDETATVSFEYNADPAAGDSAEGWTAIGSDLTSTQAPYVSVEWAPDPALVGTSVALRAVATTAATDTAPETRTYSTRNGVLLTGAGSPEHSVAVQSAGPFFAQPYADSDRTASLLAVSGSTSAGDGTVELSAWNAADGVFEGSTEATVTWTPTKFPGAPFPSSAGTFDGVLDISAFDATDGDTLAVRAERDTDDVRPTLLQAQALASISSVGDSVAGPETTEVVLQVRDQEGRTVVGAEVRRLSDGALVGYTDRLGQVRADQPTSTSERYYANSSDVDAFQQDVDVVSGQVDTPAYVPAAAATEAVLADGSVFDDNEYDEGDIALQVVDGLGAPFAAEEPLTYSLHPSDEEPSEPVTATTDDEGRLVVPFDPSGADGEYTLTFSGPASAGGTDQPPVTFVAGDAVLGLTPLAGTAPSGGTITYAGSLTVEGRPLAGRRIDLGYTPGTEQAPGAGADAALVVEAQRTLEGATTTGADGAFTVKVADLAEAGNPSETGGRLQVTARGASHTLAATADFTAVTTTPPVTPPVPTAAGKLTASLRLVGSDARDGADRLRVRGPRSVAGQKARVHVKVGDHWRAVKGVELDARGDASLTVRDGNGDRVTRYRVRLVPSPLVKAFTSRALRLR